MSKADDCIFDIRARGHAGFVKGTTLFDPCLLGLRKTVLQHVVVTDVWVSPSCRGMGHGRRMLQLCIDAADRHGVTLKVRPCAFARQTGDMSIKALRAWYARHSFCTVDGSEWMVRGPQVAL